MLYSKVGLSSKVIRAPGQPLLIKRESFLEFEQSVLVDRAGAGISIFTIWIKSEDIRIRLCRAKPVAEEKISLSQIVLRNHPPLRQMLARPDLQRLAEGGDGFPQ